MSVALTVPIEIEADPQQGLEPPPARRRARASTNSWTINVLLVEDDPADSNLVLGALRRHMQVGRAMAMDAPDYALSQLRADKFRPDLILLDIHMPKMNGFQFLEALDSIPGMRDVPVVLITTSRFARDVERASKSRVCGYIVKPESYEELRQRVHYAIDQTLNGKWSG